jgi:hypothetical protein
MRRHSVEERKDNLIVEGITFKSPKTNPSMSTVYIYVQAIVYSSHYTAVNSGSFLESAYIDR